jgi:hypothetical protein
MSEFILMLTRDDVTVSNAAELLDDALETDVKHVGFKDVGLPPDQMRDLVERLRDAGRSVHLEVVSLSEEAELRSAEIGLTLEVDYLIGGTRWREVAALIAGTPIKYFPYPGEIFDHPAKLGGDVGRLTADATEMTGSVDGINLLAFRHTTLSGMDVLRGVLANVSLPVIVAGSIDSVARVREVSDSGAWAFTIGGAVLDGRIEPGAPLASQIEMVLSATAAEQAR